jgi:phosphate transport system substrate-binding protein
MRFRRTAGLLATVAVGAAVAASTVGASGSAFSGTITADGSSTLGPYSQAAAEGFQKKNPKVRVTVGISGTGGGFERFCKGETDIANASRKIRQGAGSEAEKCKNAGIGYIAFAAANDGISIVVNQQNTWATCLTMAELKKIWEPGSKVNNWNDIRSSFPNQSLRLFGPGTDSGTFDFFTEHVNGRARASRTDYQASEDDNVLVQGVAGERGGMGYFGLSYALANQSRINIVAVDKGNGCVRPNNATVQNRSYPVSRGLYMYVKKSSFKRPVVQGFVDFILKNEKAIAVKAKFVPLTPTQLKNAKRQFKYAVLNAKKS